MNKKYVLACGLSLAMLLQTSVYAETATSISREVSFKSNLALENDRESTSIIIKGNWKEQISEIAIAKINERILIGDTNFNGIKANKVKRMKDVDGNFTKYMVILSKDDSKEIAGYMIIDTLYNENDSVVEFSLGNVYPGQNTPEGKLYYFGPLQYGEIDSLGKIKDLKTNKTLDNKNLESIRLNDKVKYKEYSNSQNESENLNETNEEIQFTTSSVVNRIFRQLSGVPDYQQNDYTGANDCTPVTATNIIMYWDAKGYPNMSYDNVPASVVSRLALFMGTTSGGTSLSNVEIGLDRYLQERYANANSDTRSNPTFNSLANEIAASRPAILHLTGYGYTSGDLGHSVTLIGTESYQETTQNLAYNYNLIIHDNWESTPRDVWISFGRGGGTIYSSTVVFPN